MNYILNDKTTPHILEQIKDGEVCLIDAFPYLKTAKRNSKKDISIVDLKTGRVVEANPSIHAIPVHSELHLELTD